MSDIDAEAYIEDMIGNEVDDDIIWEEILKDTKKTGERWNSTK